MRYCSSVVTLPEGFGVQSYHLRFGFCRKERCQHSFQAIQATMLFKPCSPKIVSHLTYQCFPICLPSSHLTFFGWRLYHQPSQPPNLHMPNKVVIDPLLSPSVVVLAWWHELLTLYPPRASNWYRRRFATLCSLGFCWKHLGFGEVSYAFLLVTSTSIHQTYHWGAKTQQKPPR